MFADDKSVQTLRQLFVELRKYLELQKEYTRLEITEKLTILLSTLIAVLLVICLGMVALFYLSFTLVYLLAPLVGGSVMSFFLIACFNVLLVILVLVFRKRLIVNPMTRFLAGLFLNKDK